MNNKLQELTDKLYSEGLTKGRVEAENIVASAQEEADKLLRNAKKEAEEILKKAKKDAEDLKQNADTELKLSSRQVINQVKQSIESTMLKKSLGKTVQQAFKSTEFLQSLIKTITENYSSGSGNTSFMLMVPEDKQDEFVQFIKNEISSDLSSQIEVKADKHLKEGFKIMPGEEGYYISFTNEAFENLFKAYLRPKLSELLFDSTI